MKIKNNSFADRYLRVAFGVIMAIAFIGVMLYAIFGWSTVP